MDVCARGRLGGAGQFLFCAHTLLQGKIVLIATAKARDKKNHHVGAFDWDLFME